MQHSGLDLVEYLCRLQHVHLCTTVLLRLTPSGLQTNDAFCIYFARLYGTLPAFTYSLFAGNLAGQYHASLSTAMFTLINKDYGDFVSLSANLAGLDKNIAELTQPMVRHLRQHFRLFHMHFSVLYRPTHAVCHYPVPMRISC